MTTGTVKFFNAEAGFGYISREHGDDVFVHVSNVESEGDEPLAEGQRVEFDIAPGRKGDEARDVRVAVDWPAAPSLRTAIRNKRDRLAQIATKTPRVVLSVVDGTVDGVARREGRGFVASYGRGRRCSAIGCSTTLSRYNSHSVCWLHSPSGSSGHF